MWKKKGKMRKKKYHLYNSTNYIIHTLKHLIDMFNTQSILKMFFVNQIIFEMPLEK